MAFDPAFRVQAEARLAEVAPLASRPMFGGVGLYSEGLFFALIAEDRLYLKVDDLNRPMFEAAGMGPFFPYGSPTPMGYWELPPGVLDDPDELAAWVDPALEVARRAAARRRPRTRAPKPGGPNGR